MGRLEYSSVQVATTEYHALGSLSGGYLFFHSSEDCESKIKMPANSVW